MKYIKQNYQKVALVFIIFHRAVSTLYSIKGASCLLLPFSFLFFSKIPLIKLLLIAKSNIYEKIRPTLKATCSLGWFMRAQLLCPYFIVVDGIIIQSDSVNFRRSSVNAIVAKFWLNYNWKLIEFWLSTIEIDLDFDRNLAGSNQNLIEFWLQSIEFWFVSVADQFSISADCRWSTTLTSQILVGADCNLVGNQSRFGWTRCLVRLGPVVGCRLSIGLWPMLMVPRTRASGGRTVCTRCVR